MAKKVQLMTNAKEWQTVNGVEVLVDVPQEDIDPITDSNCVEIEGHRTLEETINQENMFTPEIVETKVHSKVGGVYHDNVVDGAYEEAILYGNTQVNLVESMTSDTKYIPHSFTSFQGNESKIGNYHNGRTNQVAPLVKGVTMVNLAQTTSAELTQGQSLCVENIKGNTEYTISFVFTQKNSGAGIVIQSYNGETYLENSKLQSNLGDEVVMTFITHENANKIYVNNGVGYGGETIQLDNIMVIEGDVTDLDLPFFKGMRSVELSRPLTNLFTDDLVPEVMGVTVTNSGDTVTVASTTISTWASARYHLDLKPNTKYVIMWDGLTFTQTASGIDYIISVCENDTIFSHMGNKFTTLRSIIFDTGDKSAISIRIHATTSNSETGTTTVTGLRVFEWDDSLHTLDLQTIGYFSGTKYVSARALETEGKNLYPYGDINFTPTQVQWHDAKGTNYMYGDIAQKSKCRFLLKKGTYKLSSDYNNRTNLGYMALVTDKEETMKDTTFTLEEDTYLTLRLQPLEANVPTTLTNIQIERGETATEYEAYQSRYYKPRETEEIILRSLPNGVCDTFNLQTGELVQRIHSHVFDGATYELNFMNTPGEVSGDDVVGGWSSLYNMYAPKHNSFSVSCDIPTRQRTSTSDSDYVNKEFFMIGVNTFIISLSKTRLNGLSISQYLTRNPITVQYELAEPIITKLQTYNRVYSGQTNAPTSMGNNLSALTYYNSNYYLKVGNLSPVPAILEPITTIPYDVRLKPSTLYTIKYNRGGNSNSMKFDLGGSVVEKTNATDLGIVAEEFTVRTPAILSHEQLILSGTGYAHSFIIVEGDITGTELPYFEGMKDVKMPIVKNIGKNLFDIQSIYQGLKNIAPNNVLLLNDNTLQIKSTGEWHEKDLGKPIKFKENTRYTLSFYAKDINNTGELPDTIICFVYTDGTTNYSRTWGGDNVCTSIAGKTVDYINFSYCYGDGRMAEFSNFMLVEGTEAQLYEPYKENSVYAVKGEYPITSEMFEQGGFSTGNATSDGSYETMKYGEENGNYLKRLRSKNLIPVKPNTTYAFAHSFSKFIYNVYQWNGNKRFIDGTSQKFTDGQVETITTTADTQYIHFLMSKDDISQNITVGEYDWSQFHMYELDSTINLRSLPNGVKDELNLLTGEYIQRVGEIVFDGSEDEMWKTASDNTGGAFRFETLLLSGKFNGVTYDKEVPALLCDKYATYKFYDIYRGNAVGITFYYSSHIVIYDNKYTDLASFKQALQSNPITIQYELAEPIISHVRLVSNNQEREVGVKLPNGVCNTYNPSTGITTVRVGKVVLDGSEDWFINTTKTNTQVFGLIMPDMAKTQNNLYCKTMVVGSGVDAERITTTHGNIYIALLKTKASTVDELKTYLASNPITVWYELKYPQIQPDIVLPNGVHDEYNPETGVYTKKVGFVELDGGEDWRFFSTNVDNETRLCLTDRPDAKIINTPEEESIMSDKLPCDYNLYVNDNEGIHVFSAKPITEIAIRIKASKLSPINNSSLKTYLSQNPIKVWYELATPITYQLTPYFGLPMPYAYKDGYLIHESAYPETTLPPEFKYKLVANRTGQIVQNGRKLQEHTTRLSNLEALIIEATIESLFNRELQTFELELMDIQLIEL